MTEQETGAEGVQQAPETAEKTTTYLVQRMREQDDGTFVATGWEDVGRVTVPRRTQRATVRQKAAEMVAEHHAPDVEQAPVEFRAIPVDEIIGGKASLEVPPPQVRVTEL